MMSTLAEVLSSVATVLTSVLTNLGSIITFIIGQPIIVAFIALAVVGRLLIWAKETIKF